MSDEPNGPPAWKIDFVPEAERWYKSLDDRQAKKIELALDQLEAGGPATCRPRVDSIKGSRHHNMKEVRAVGKHLRVLFAFDSRRHAIVLLGGDKTNNWRGWYRENVPRADRRYDRHLRDLRRGGPIWTTRYRDLRRGGRSEPSVG